MGMFLMDLKNNWLSLLERFNTILDTGRI